jgi:parallel beta-helix repeat protein
VYVKNTTGPAYGTIDMKSNVHIVGTDASGGIPASRNDYPTLYSGPLPLPNRGRAPVRLLGPLSNCKLAYLKITGGKMEEGQIYVSGVHGEIGNDVVIENCWLNQGSHVGIMLRGAAAPTIRDCDIEHPITSGISSYRYGIDPASTPLIIEGCNLNGSGAGSGMRSGIRLSGNGSVGIQVAIGGSGVDDRNTISNNGHSGIRLEDIDEFSIENNDISNNGKGGILVLDSSSVSPHVKNNDIYNHVNSSGINIGGGSTVTIGDNNDIYSNEAGIAFYVANNGDIDRAKSSSPVTITGNNIYSNSEAGIAVRDGIDASVTTITQNNIYSNGMGGIRIQRKCQLDISRNEIHDNLKGGIHTGSDVADGGGFGSDLGTAILTIEKNKFYQNGSGGYGAGIDVRHASGTIYNNLVYNNYKGGIRFGDYITEIVNNTVVGNGNAAGGGIAYDDLAGAVNAPVAGVPDDPLLILNNISVYNVTAGIRACFDNTEGSEERDYNLVYANNGTGETNCGYPDRLNKRCANKNFGGCGSMWNPTPPPWVILDGPNNMIADPLFKDMVGNDYRLQRVSEGDSNDSPGIDAGDDGFDMGAYGGSEPIDW